MCGVCGLYNYTTGEPAARHIVYSQATAMAHRGPDDDGFHFDGALGMGMRRLSIIDIAGGAQPMTNEAKTVWVVFNGEVYNFKELRGQLQAFGHTFRTKSDTETIVHAYEQWGTDCLSRFNGMFGLALWDSARRRLLLARDPFGIKPLYYWDNGKTLVFGSEIKVVLGHPAVPRAVDIKALDDYLTFAFVPSPRTAFAGIKKIAPGEALTCSEQGIRLHRFHRTVPTLLEDAKQPELIESVRAALATAVKRQMVADVPVGVMLSGGVDSTTVAAIMKEAGGPVQTFTVGFGGDFDRNELDKARLTARRLGTDHHELTLSAEDYADFLPVSIWHLEEPIATTSTLAFYKLCELASEKVKVVLTGQGADEPFGGYPRYLGEHYSRLYRRLPRMVRRGLIAPLVELLPRNEKAKRAARSLDIAEPLDRLLAIYTIADDALKSRLYRDGLPRDAGREAVYQWQSAVAGRDGLTQMLYIDARFSLADNLLLYADKMAMAVSLEARVPFLDLELMALVESIPPKFKIRGRTQKYILKKAVSKWIPDATIGAPKIGFETPIDAWFRGEFNSTAEAIVLDPGSACRVYFQAGTIKQMLKDHKAGREDHKRPLFSLLTFELWHRQFLRPGRIEKP